MSEDTVLEAASDRDEELERLSTALPMLNIVNKNNAKGGAKQPLTDITPPSQPQENEEPTLMDLMMKEAMEAKKQKEAIKAKEEARVSKQEFGSGLKGGFFASKKSSTKKQTEVPKKEPAKELQTIRPKADDKKDSLRLEEVQTAMAESTNPLLKKLEGGDWITPQLLEKITKSPILMAGMKDPKCTAAIELMQKNPKEAMERFRSDATVHAFLMEFGKMMGSHFEELGSKQKVEAQAPKVRGPLAEEAIKRNQMKQPRRDVPKEEDQQVQKILSDPELRDLLMDPKLQAILQECGHPQKLMHYLNDGVIGPKIRRLAQAGLVKFQ